MPNYLDKPLFEFFGTIEDHAIIEEFGSTDGDQIYEDTDAIQSAKGKEGNNEIRTSRGIGLAAMDMVGNEWVHNSAASFISDYGSEVFFGDIIKTGDGKDVLLGNGGKATPLCHGQGLASV